MFIMAGCGKSGLTTDDLPFSSATRVRPEAAGAHCEAGGQAIETGLDSNRNGALEDGEVDETAYVCTPVAAPNTPALVRIDAVEAGNDCAHGGYRVNAGVDANANGVLDDVEITETALACASADGQPGAPGSDGGNGNNGANGTSAVLGSEPIAPGAECVNGGTRMNAGLDDNGNGVLDEAEISASVAVL